jgi:hypothetical protein
VAPEDDDEDHDREHAVGIFADVAQTDLAAIVETLHELAHQEDEVGEEQQDEDLELGQRDLVAGWGQVPHLEEDEREEADDQDQDDHLVVAEQTDE